MNGDPTQFEEPILQLRRQIEEAQAADADPETVAELQQKLTKTAGEIFAGLTPWQKTLVARHPQRPYTLDFIANLFEEWTEIHGDRKFADATAVAGVRSITGSWRRAVVVVLSASDDMSKHDPRVVRRYLQSIGVPLFVWSVTGPHPELEQAWGKIDDVSSMGKLGRAVGHLRETLAQQRVAWVDVDPLRALHLQAKESCGVAVMAQPAP